MALPPFLAKIFAGKGSDLIKSVTDGLDGLITNKEELLKAKLEVEKEVNRHLEELAEDAYKTLELQYKDTADARAANVSIQGESPSWLAKNTAYIIDIFVMLIWASLTTYILAKFMNIIATDSRADFTGILGIWAGVTALATTVLNFHRGSSQGSATKQKTIDKMIDGK